MPKIRRWFHASHDINDDPKEPKLITLPCLTSV